MYMYMHQKWYPNSACRSIKTEKMLMSIVKFIMACISMAKFIDSLADYVDKEHQQLCGQGTPTFRCYILDSQQNIWRLLQPLNSSCKESLQCPLAMFLLVLGCQQVISLCFYSEGVHFH